jgi:hypothetical protein
MQLPRSKIHSPLKNLRLKNMAKTGQIGQSWARLPADRLFTPEALRPESRFLLKSVHFRTTATIAGNLEPSALATAEQSNFRDNIAAVLETNPPESD